MWKVEYIEVDFSFIKAIQNNNKEIIMIVDNLSNETINKIIQLHNNAISQSYKEGLKDGVKLMEELRS